MINTLQGFLIKLELIENQERQIMKLSIFVNDIKIIVLEDDEVEEMVYEYIIENYPEMTITDDDDLLVVPIF